MIGSHRLLLALLLCCAGISGCHPAPSVPTVGEPTAPPWFQDITAESGIDFVHDAGPTGTFFLPQIVGSGAAVLDFDGDGLLDLYLLTNGGPESRSKNQLFKQLPGGRFKNVSDVSHLDIAGHNMGAAVADVDNDGRPDILVTQYRGARLFHNEGGGVFRDISKQAGIDNPLWGTSAAFADFDRDGWLDLVIVNYVDYDPSRPCNNGRGQRDFCGPNAFDGSTTKLFRNRGLGADGCVHFQDLTASSGLAGAPGPGLGVVCADFNGDGWPDIFVANDGKPNHLWINQKNNTFKEEAMPHGLAYDGAGHAQAGMGVALGDVDGDGLFDVFVTHLTEETNTLWRQHPSGMFRDRTLASGLAQTQARGTGFGVVFGDFNCDGRLDLAVANGRVHRGPPRNEAVLGSFWALFGERNRLWEGADNGRFHDRTDADPGFAGDGAVSRGLIVADLDDDGGLDLIVTAAAGPARVFRNVAPQRGHWLSVRAWEPKFKRDAYGAVATVRSQGKTWRRWLNPGHSFLCSNDPRAHFGLGEVERIDAIDLAWPDGSRERFHKLSSGKPIPVDKAIELRHGEGEALP